jgi:hypothetical protein
MDGHLHGYAGMRHKTIEFFSKTLNMEMFIIKHCVSQAWWYTPVVQALRDSGRNIMSSRQPGLQSQDPVSKNKKIPDSISKVNAWEQKY